MKDIDILVLATPHRRIITAEGLTEHPHIIHYSTDYNLPEEFAVADEYMQWSSHKFSLGHYRSFRGWQDALAKCTQPYILGFEDDAVPNRQDWWNVVLKSVEMLKEFEIVSLHGRRVNFKDFQSKEHKGLRFYHKKAGVEWIKVNGSPLAWLLKKETVEKFRSFEFRGCPTDQHLAN